MAILFCLCTLMLVPTPDLMQAIPYGDYIGVFHYSAAYRDAGAEAFGAKRGFDESVAPFALVAEVIGDFCGAENRDGQKLFAAALREDAVAAEVIKTMDMSPAKKLGLDVVYSFRQGKERFFAIYVSSHHMFVAADSMEILESSMQSLAGAALSVVDDELFAELHGHIAEDCSHWSMYIDNRSLERFQSDYGEAIQKREYASEHSIRRSIEAVERIYQKKSLAEINTRYFEDDSHVWDWITVCRSEEGSQKWYRTRAGNRDMYIAGIERQKSGGDNNLDMLLALENLRRTSVTIDGKIVRRTEVLDKEILEKIAKTNRAKRMEEEKKK